MQVLMMPHFFDTRLSVFLLILWSDLYERIVWSHLSEHWRFLDVFVMFGLLRALLVERSHACLELSLELMVLVIPSFEDSWRPILSRIFLILLRRQI